VALNEDLLAQGLREPVQLVSREVVAVSLCSAPLCSGLVLAVDEVLAVAEQWAPGVAHVGPDASAFAIRLPVHAVINPHVGQVIDTASVLEEARIWVLDEETPGLQILDDLDACADESICPLEVPRGLGIRSGNAVLRAVRRGPNYVKVPRFIEALVIPLGDVKAERWAVFVVPINVHALPASSLKGLAHALRA